MIYLKKGTFYLEKEALLGCWIYIYIFCFLGGGKVPPALRFRRPWSSGGVIPGVIVLGGNSLGSPIVLGVIVLGGGNCPVIGHIKVVS